MMKRLGLALGVCLMAAAVQAEPARVGGVWNMTVELPMGTGHPTVSFNQDGEKLTGTYAGRYGQSALEGTVKENQIQFAVRVNAEGTEVVGVFAGTVDGDTMGGTVDFGEGGQGTWSATRAPEKKR